MHVVFFGTRDSFYYYLYHAISKDGGNSFSAPVTISEVHIPRFSPDEANLTVPGIEINRVYPSEHLAIDHSSGPNKGNLYLVWAADGIGKNNGNGMDIYFSISKDNGNSWSSPKIINDDYSDSGQGIHQFHPSITVNPIGKISLGWYDRRGYPAYDLETNYYMANSDDGGQTFTKNFPITNKESDFNDIGLDNGYFGIGEYTQIVSTTGYVIPFWADGRDNNGNIDIYTTFIKDTSSTAPQKINAGINISALYPNPASTTITADFTLEQQESLDISVSNVRGQILWAQNNTSYGTGRHTLSANISTLYSGDYFFVIHSKSGSAVKPFVIITKN